jgi:hypothetical protein
MPGYESGTSRSPGSTFLSKKEILRTDDLPISVKKKRRMTLHSRMEWMGMMKTRKTQKKRPGDFGATFAWGYWTR